jgi:hypothetical protein
MNLNPNEAKVLVELADDYRCDFGYRGFAYLTRETGLDRKVVRRACRSLARKGLAQYGRGLWSENGEPAGSGYAATKFGVERAKDLPRQCEGCSGGIAEPPGRYCPGCEAYRDHTR